MLPLKKTQTLKIRCLIFYVFVGIEIILKKNFRKHYYCIKSMRVQKSVESRPNSGFGCGEAISCCSVAG
jgi:hypothetical protein